MLIFYQNTKGLTLLFCSKMVTPSKNADFDRKSAFLDGVIFKQKRKVNPFLSKKVRLTPWYFDRKSAFLDGLLFQQKSKVNPLVF